MQKSADCGVLELCGQEAITPNYLNYSVIVDNLFFHRNTK